MMVMMMMTYTTREERGEKGDEQEVKEMSQVTQERRAMAAGDWMRRNEVKKSGDKMKKRREWKGRKGRRTGIEDAKEKESKEAMGG